MIERVRSYSPYKETRSGEMLAPTLTSEAQNKLESLSADQISVLHFLSQDLKSEKVAEKLRMPIQKVERVMTEIESILGDSATELYREYGRQHGFDTKWRPQNAPRSRRRRRRISKQYIKISDEFQ